jgi:AcrR family transcriptional regulator
MDASATTTRRRRSDGERSRRTILAAAARLATVEGLDGLSIGRLAEHIGMSKSGLYAHFGSKEELQLATIETAEAVFQAEVLEPGLAAPTPLARIEALCEAFLSHVERSVFPGGCFFASVGAELDTRPGRVRDRVAQVDRHWSELLSSLVAEAQQAGELGEGDDPQQLAFELSALLSYGNDAFLLQEDPAALARARSAIATRLAVSRR